MTHIAIHETVEGLQLLMSLWKYDPLYGIRFP